MRLHADSADKYPGNDKLDKFFKLVVCDVASMPVAMDASPIFMAAQAFLKFELFLFWA